LLEAVSYWRSGLRVAGRVTGSETDPKVCGWGLCSGWQGRFPTLRREPRSPRLRIGSEIDPKAGAEVTEIEDKVGNRPYRAHPGPPHPGIGSETDPTAGAEVAEIEDRVGNRPYRDHPRSPRLRIGTKTDPIATTQVYPHRG